MSNASAETETEPEALAAALYRKLSREQRNATAFPWDDPRREQIDSDWRIVPQESGAFFSRDQQAATEAIVRGLIRNQPGSVSRYSVGFFGEPTQQTFQMVIAGDGCTLRCGGAAAARAVCGGPVLYTGHIPATEVFQSLTASQRTTATQPQPRIEQGSATVRIPKPGRAPTGLLVSTMNSQQQRHVRSLLELVAQPLRHKDAADALQQIENAGGVGALSIAFYSKESWSLESPSAVVYVRQRVWINIRYP